MAQYTDEYDDEERKRGALLGQMPGPSGVPDYGMPKTADPGPDARNTTPPDSPLPPSAPPRTPPGQGAAPPPPPAPPPGPQATPNPTQPTDSADAQTLLRWIMFGKSPQDAIAQFNRQFGRSTGNEAVYYDPSVHGRATIGLPEAYLSQESDGWRLTQRTPEGPGGGGVDQRRDPGPAPNPGGMAFPPEIAQFYAAQTAAIQRQQEEDARIKATMRDQLLRLMDQGSQPMTDIGADPAAAAYRTGRRREAGKDREALAERAAFLGLNPGGQGSGSFETGIQGLNEDASEDIAGYEANRAVDELTQRRNMMMQALQMANALGARTEATSLQRELAMIDTQIKQQQLGFQYAGLNQQQGQFEDSMGFNYANLLSNLNRQSYLDLM